MGKRPRFGSQSRLQQMEFETEGRRNEIKNLGGREGSMAVLTPPPLDLEKRFSRAGCGRIVPLHSKVMREWLFTGPCGCSGQSILSGPIFSGPEDCDDFGE